MNSTSIPQGFGSRILRSVHVQFWIGTFLGGLLVPMVEGAVNIVVANKSEAIKQQVQLLIQYINKLYENPPKTVSEATTAVAYFDAHRIGTKPYMRPDGFDEANAYAKSTLAELQQRDKAKEASEAKARADEQSGKARETKEAEERKRLEAEAAAKSAEAERQRLDAERKATELASERAAARELARKSWKYN